LIKKIEHKKNLKECDNNKIRISNNFILSISLLIMFDTLLLRPSLHCNTPLHFTALHPTTLHYTSLHFTTLHSTTLTDTSLPLIYTSLPFHLALELATTICKVNFTLEQAMKAEKGCRLQFYYFFNLGARCGWLSQHIHQVQC
jgi:hypothetical protein